MERIGVIYGGYSGVVGALERYYGRSGVIKECNGVEVVRVREGLCAKRYRRGRSSYRGISRYYYIGGDISTLPKELQRDIECKGYKEYDMTEAIREIQELTYGRKGRQEREVYLRGMLSGLLGVITQDVKGERVGNGREKRAE